MPASHAHKPAYAGKDCEIPRAYLSPVLPPPRLAIP